MNRRHGANQYKQRMGWTFPWASSAMSDFNYDFRVTHSADEWRSGSVEYNFRQMDVRPAGEMRPDVIELASGVGTDWSTTGSRGRA